MGRELRPYWVALEAWFRNRGTPAGLKPKGPTNSFADVLPNGSFETAKSKAKPIYRAWIECGMEAWVELFGWIGGMVWKHRNPSKTPATCGTSASLADADTLLVHGPTTLRRHVKHMHGLATRPRLEVALAPCTGWPKMRCCH